jgi:lipopolysaccharide export system permease protein
VLKDILPLLISGQVSLGRVAQAMSLLIPFVWVFALPMGMLTATLLVFGRFSADQEFTAVRAGGISLLSIISPILLLSLGLCLVSAMVNMEIGPRSRVAYKKLFTKLQVEIATAYLPEGRFQSFGDRLFVVKKNRGGELEDVLMFDLKKGETLHAQRGKLEMDMPNKQIILRLFDWKGLNIGEHQVLTPASSELTVTLPIEQQNPGPQKPSIDDMTFWQLRAELQVLRRQADQAVAAANLLPREARVKQEQYARQLKTFAADAYFNLHRQVSFSFACLGFTLIGIPLGIRVHRRETNVGIAIALVLVAVYYSFVLVAQGLATHPEYAPHLIVWLPNFLFQGVGAVLLWRANRG